MDLLFSLMAIINIQLSGAVMEHLMSLIASYRFAQGKLHEKSTR
jgi:hypothetical protein